MAQRFHQKPITTAINPDDLIVIAGPDDQTIDRVITFEAFVTALGVIGSGLVDGIYGDIQVTDNGQTFTVRNDVITLAKLQNFSQGAFVARVSSGTGSLEVIDAETMRNALGVAGLTDGNKGDVSVSASGTVWTVNAGAITLPKLQQVATGVILGRHTNLTGQVELLNPAQVRDIIDLNVDNDVVFATLSIESGTITIDEQTMSISGTLNNAGVNFSILKMNYADVASGSKSVFVDLQMGSDRRFAVTKFGGIVTKEQTTPSTPSANTCEVFLDSADNDLKVRLDTGDVKSLTASVANLIALTITAHGRVSADIGKPLVRKPDGTIPIWDDTDGNTYPSGLLQGVTDVNNLSLASAGGPVVCNTAILESTDVATRGRWYAWDASVGKWMHETPSDSAWPGPWLEVLHISGSSATVVLRDR